MRWLLGVGGALALVAASYLAMRPRWTRPVLRVGIIVQNDRPEEEAVLKGVALALDERDQRGGRFRVVVGPQDNASVRMDFKVWMPGLESVPQAWPDDRGATLIAPDVEAQADVLLAWAKARGLRRVTVPKSSLSGLRPDLGRVLEKRMPAGDLLRPGVEGKADLMWGYFDSGHDRLHREEFAGPIFLAADCLSLNPDFDGCLTVLAPLKAPPSGFQGDVFVYAGHLATLRLLDALDADPAAEPQQFCLPWVFERLLGEPRVYEVRGGRFIPK